MLFFWQETPVPRGETHSPLPPFWTTPSKSKTPASNPIPDSAYRARLPLMWCPEQWCPEHSARQRLTLGVGVFLIRAPIQWSSIGSPWPELMHEGKSHGYTFLIHTWTNKFAVAAGSWFGSHNSKEGN